MAIIVLKWRNHCVKKRWYKSKVFVITGASGGIGKEVSRLFAPLGMRMYLLDLPNPVLNELATELTSLGAEHAEAMACDLTNRDQVESVIKNIGEKEKCIDILYNNAGIGNKASITNGGTFEDYRKLMQINVDGMWLVLQAAVPYIGRPAPNKKYPNRKVGQLIFSSSLGGKTGVPNMAAYAMSKYAIIGLADTLRMEYRGLYGKKSIQVITTCAAPANTGFYNAKDMTAWREKYKKRGRLFKFVEAKDIAERVLKASFKYKKEICIPGSGWILILLNLKWKGYVERILVKTEKEK